MSLRNHNPILERHIKGHRFEQVDKEKLLQFREGRKRVESSIPTLPIKRLSQLNHKELSLSGRNKIRKELSVSEESSLRQSLGTAPAQEEVHKIAYEGNKRWMGSENL